MEGKGVWFDTEDQARAYVFRHFKRGARSFDVGCFQINYKWHGTAFKSIDEMFDPLANARYAARFLAKLYQETGNWSDAAGSYHSRTPKYANKYKKIFDRYHAKMQNLPAPERYAGKSTAQTSNSSKRRMNNFPLLQSNTTSSHLGSLVPLSNQRTPTALFSLASQTEGF